jgi:uncharacterized membrane protein
MRHQSIAGHTGDLHSGRNVSTTERIGTGIGGALLALYGLNRGGGGGLLGALAGGALLLRAASGHCPVYARLGASEAEHRLAQQRGWQTASIHRETVRINRPREQLYAFWREQTNLASAMSHVERVDMLDSKRTHWVVTLPLGKQLEWNATITEDRPNERIAWRAEADAELQNAGWVEFREVAGGTEVTVELAFEPPAGELGRTLLKLWPNSPGALLKNDLKELKQRFERGELSAGGRSALEPHLQQGSPTQRH